jgi:3-oxoacyl-[acyl-carrier-protein] synthase III
VCVLFGDGAGAVVLQQVIDNDNKQQHQSVHTTTSISRSINSSGSSIRRSDDTTTSVAGSDGLGVGTGYDSPCGVLGFSLHSNGADSDKLCLRYEENQSQQQPQQQPQQQSQQQQSQQQQQEKQPQPFNPSAGNYGYIYMEGKEVGSGHSQQQQPPTFFLPCLFKSFHQTTPPLSPQSDPQSL